MAMTQSEMMEKLEEIYNLLDYTTEHLQRAQELTTDINKAFRDAIHQDLTEVRWYKTAEVQPRENQRVIVQDAHGAQYFMTYPFSHTKYPLWWVIPQNNE